MKSGKPFELKRQDTYLAFLYGGVGVLIGMIITNIVVDMHIALNIILLLLSLVLFLRSLSLFKLYKKDKLVHDAKKFP